MGSWQCTYLLACAPGERLPRASLLAAAAAHPPQTAPKATTTVKVTTYAAKAGRSAWANRKTITKTVKVGGKVYDDIQDYETAYAEDFEGQVSFRLPSHARPSRHLFGRGLRIAASRQATLFS